MSAIGVRIPVIRSSVARGRDKTELRHTRLRALSVVQFSVVRCSSPDPGRRCHLCGWIERIPGGTRQNDGLETGIVGAAAAGFAWTLGSLSHS